MTSPLHTDQSRGEAAFLRQQHQAHLARRARLWRRPVERKVVTRPAPEAKSPAVEAEEELPVGAPFNFLLRPSPRAILKLMALKHGVDVADITGPARNYTIVAIRDQTILLVHTHCPRLTLPDLGRLFGGRDHSTILHSLRKTTGRKGRLYAH